MRNNGLRLLVFLMLSLALSSPNTGLAKDSANAPTLVTIPVGDWPPYVSAEKPFDGILPHIVTAAFELQDIKTAYRHTDWTRAYGQVKNATHPVSIGWMHDSSRADDMYFSEPITHITLSFFHRKKMNFRWKNLASLKRYRIGFVTGYSYGDEFNEAIKQGTYQVTEFATPLDAFNALLSSEIDLLPSDTIVGQAILSGLDAQKMGDIIVDEHPLLVTPVHMIASLNNPTAIALVKSFNQGLNELKQNGRYKRIVSSTNLIDAISKLRFLTEESAPLNYKENGTAKGISVAVVAEILKELESNVGPTQFEVQPWARAYKTALQKDNIALFSIIKTPERKSKFQWVGPIYRANVVLFSRKNDTLKGQSINAFSKQAICAVREDVGAQLIASLGHPEEYTHLIPTAAQCAKMLQLGRVNLWAYGADTGRWYLSKTGADLSQFEETLHLHESFRYIALSKNISTQVVEAFQETLDYLHLSGRLQSIIEAELQSASTN